MSDLTIDCPNCAESVKKNAVSCRFCNYGLSDKHYRDCDSCGERIKISAKLCRFCAVPTRAPLTTLSKPITAGVDGESVRQQVFEVIVRQAMAGVPWRQVCQGPMQVNGITFEEIEEELKRRNIVPFRDRLLEKQQEESAEEESKQSQNTCNLADMKFIDGIVADLPEPKSKEKDKKEPKKTPKKEKDKDK